MVLPPITSVYATLVNQLGPFFDCSYSNGFAECQLQNEFDAITSSVAILIFFIAYSFIWSLICNNVSKVDQIWSITPGVYCCHYLYIFYAQESSRGREPIHQRLALITGLVVLWGVRLTYNFWRRGGYGNLIFHEEDYRWPILRKKMSSITFFFFNLSFIATFQNVLLWLITYPAYVVLQSKRHHIHFIDIILAGFFLLLLVMETIADQQHYNFHTAKNKMTPDERKKSPHKDIKDGFLQSGLFFYSRHPNYFAEQAMWIVIYLFTISVTGDVLNYSAAGFIILILLFQGSMSFGESITLSKYPAYADYQLRTSQCVPFPKRGKSFKKV